MKKSTILLLILIGIVLVFAVTGLLIFREPVDRMLREYGQTASGELSDLERSVFTSPLGSKLRLV